MEPNQTSQQTQPTTPEIQTAPTKEIPNAPTGKTKYILLGVSILLILLVLGGGAYYLGVSKQQSTPQKNKNLTTFTITPSPSQIASNSGLITYTNTKLPGNSLEAYTISYPISWNRNVRRTAELIDELTLTKENYTITITQTAGGGAGCIFEGQVPNGPYGDYRNKQYTELTSPVGILRRFENTPPNQGDNTLRFDFCASVNGVYQTPTSVGSIMYTVPKNYDNSLLKEMDSIIETLKEAK